MHPIYLQLKKLAQLNKVFLRSIVCCYLLLLSFTSHSQVVISEVYANGSFQLTNIGTEAVDVSSYWICSFPSYVVLNSLDIACGTTIIDPTESTTFSGFEYTLGEMPGSELGLYRINDFGNANEILAYVEWGSEGHRRSSLAVEAGIWQEGNFAPNFQATESLVLMDDEWSINGEPMICPVEDTATNDDMPMTSETYTITFNADWSSETHPTDFPSNAHFSGLIGMTHTSDTTLFVIGSPASTGIKSMAETGAKIFLIQEIQQMVMQGTGGSLISGSGIDISPGSVSVDVVASSTHPLISVTSMIAPSPDWFIGVKDVELYNDGKWVDQITIPVGVYDAGTDSGESYSSSNVATEPQGLIEMITDGPLAVNGIVPSLGSITIRREGAPVDTMDNSNPIDTMETCDLSQRLITTTDTTTFCVGEGVDDLINVEVNLLQDDATYLETTWIITDTLGTILGLPAGPPFNLEDAGEGVCRIWNLNHAEGLQGLAVTNHIEELEGCYTFSNPIEVTRLSGDVCPSPVDTMETNPVDTMETNPVDTMETNPVDTMETNPVDTMDTNPVDTMDTNPVDTMETNPVDTMETNPVDTMETNPVDTMSTVCDVAGGTLTGGPFEFCVGDSIPDNLTADAISLSGSLGANSQWVVTDSSGITILGLPENPSDVNFEEAGSGTCLIWHLAYQDSLSGVAANGLVADIQGCFSLSNAVTIIRNSGENCATDTTTTETTNPTDSMACTVSGGVIEGGPFEFCVGDTIADQIPVDGILLNDNIGTNSQWVVTDSAGVTILGLPNAPSDVDFEGAGIGVCQLWHLSYEDSLMGAVVDGNVADLQGCFSLSNPISVTRKDCGEADNETEDDDMGDDENSDDTEEDMDDENNTEGEDMDDNEDGNNGDTGQDACTAPTDPTVTLQGSKKAVITWTAVDAATRYVIQIRFKGQTRWAARAVLRKSTVRIFAPAGKDYEYHIKSICGEEESEYGEIFEFTTPPRGIITSESRSSGDDFQADIVLVLPTKQLVLTPNPVKNQLQIDYPITTENTKVFIYSASGQKVYEQSLAMDTFGQTINVGHLENGFYILRIVEDGATAVSHKLIKQ